MDKQHVILCGGESLPKGTKGDVLQLNAWAPDGTEGAVKLKIEDLHSKLLKPVPRKFEDLLDIATYVYCADQATSRGGKDVDTFGGNWRRQFHFHIPVREPDLWNSTDVKETLIQTLRFLSDDFYDFTFTQAKNAPGMQDYFDKLKLEEPLGELKQVVMFSGGLDSLAGAVEEAVNEKRRVILVNHRPTDKLNNVHKRLEARLADKAGKYKPTHLHVHINKSKDLNKSYLQRARSFLYVSIGATVAEMLGHESVRFYENGVVSLNLPASAQVVGSRATRTTHPRVLEDFGNLLRLVADHPFTVENPFIWNTKGEVIEKIMKADCEELIGASISCAHTFSFSNEHPHCGTCSQCIDRRFGILAAGAQDFDPASGYASDVFTGKRPLEEDRMMVAVYLDRAKRVGKLKAAADLIKEFPDVVRTLKYFKEGPTAAADKIVALHQRHGKEVKTVLKKMIAGHNEEIIDHALAHDCLLTIAYDSGRAERTEDAPNKEVPGKKKFQKQQEERWEKQKESENTYRLSRGYGGFLLVFKGETEALQDDRATVLTEYLLKNPPDEPIHAVELEAKVLGSSSSENFLGKGADVIEVDDENFTPEATGKRLMGSNVAEPLRKKFTELNEIMNDETLPEDEREAARDERISLLKDLAKGGKTGGQASKTADRVRKAIKGLIDELKKAKRSNGEPNTVLREFGKHLEEFLWLPSMGGRNRKGAVGKPGCYTYIHPTGVKWRD